MIQARIQHGRKSRCLEATKSPNRLFIEALFNWNLQGQKLRRVGPFQTPFPPLSFS